MKNFICLFAFLCIAYSGFSQGSKSDFSSLHKQRSEQYSDFSSLPEDSEDILKLVYANTILETDNKLFSMAVAMDSSISNLTKEIETVKKNSELTNNKWLLIIAGTGGLIFLLWIAFLIMFFISRSRSLRIKKELLKLKQQTDA